MPGQNPKLNISFFGRGNKAEKINDSFASSTRARGVGPTSPSSSYQLLAKITRVAQTSHRILTQTQQRNNNIRRFGFA